MPSTYNVLTHLAKHKEIQLRSKYTQVEIEKLTTRFLNELSSYEGEELTELKDSLKQPLRKP